MTPLAQATGVQIDLRFGFGRCVAVSRSLPPPSDAERALIVICWRPQVMGAMLRLLGADDRDLPRASDEADHGAMYRFDRQAHGALMTRIEQPF